MSNRGSMGAEVDLHHHGDREVAPGLLDFATNVRLVGPPPWLHERLSQTIGTLGAYPDAAAARRAVADRHARPVEEVLLTAGAAEAFTLIARTTAARSAACVHPSFTAPEAALRAAGRSVRRIVLAPPFALDPGAVPPDADLVVVGNPTNPTSILHPAGTLAGLARPGRMLVVDEAFADCVPGEAESLARRRDLPGLVVVRSLTKSWGLAGLRIGYVLAEPALIGRLAAAQPPWSVSSPAAVAAEAASAPAALAEVDAWARALAHEREALAEAIDALPELAVVRPPAASFMLVSAERGAALRTELRARGVAIRRGDTFPGLGPDWLRVSVRDAEANGLLLAALRAAVGG